MASDGLAPVLEVLPSGGTSAPGHPHQLALFEAVDESPPYRAHSSQPDLTQYDRILVAHSGGKDSMACLLHLLDLGVPASKLELHHHDVDGREGSDLMDWPVTRSYVQAIGNAFGIPVFFSWRQGGFEREMLRQNSGTAPVVFTRGDGEIVTMGGERSPPNTRRRFPQVSANLAVRWCSSVLKIDVMARLLANDERFRHGKTLIVTGERAEESACRARYAEFEPHRCDLRAGRRPRWIDQWRPVHAWTEAQVWEQMRKWRVMPHPAYYVGFGRTSCMKCIFGSPNQWRTIQFITPKGFDRIARYEQEFGVTIHRRLSVIQQAQAGSVYPSAERYMDAALSDTFHGPVFVDPWLLPAGAFGEGTGPT